jgi:hypothetical protein
MSESKSSESLIKTWAETQQKLLTNWLDTVRRSGGAPGPELWTKTVEAWQASVKETLDVQAEWTREWTETLSNAKGTPKELQALARQGRELLQHWTDAERQLWQGWFNIVKDINLRLEPTTGAKAGTDLIQLWQESAHKMIDTQAALVRRWTSGFTGTRPNE